MLSKWGSRQHQQGFTIVELMIATAVFSIVLLIVTAGVISFTRQYYKGIVSNNTQTVTRTIVSEMTQAIQFSGADSISIIASGGGRTQGVCINGRPYYYAIGWQVTGDTATGAKHGLVTSTGSCADAVPDITTQDLDAIGSDARELLGDKMRLTYFKVSPPTDTQLATVDIRVAYGDKDLLCSPNVTDSCKPDGGLDDSDLQTLAGDNKVTCRSGIGNQFCAISSLNAQVVNRLQ